MVKKMFVMFCFMLIMNYIFPEYSPPDLKELQKKADNGDAYSQAVLGEIYHRGENVDADFEKSLKWFYKAAEQNEPLALFYLGIIGFTGQDAGEKYRDPFPLFFRAFPGLKKLADENNPRAQAALSTLYRYGLGTDRDVQKANELVAAAAEQGFPRALYFQGLIYFNGMGVEQDYEKAKEVFLKLKKMGDNEAAYQIANMYYNGYGFEKDEEKAMKIFSEVQEYNTIYETMVKDGDYIIPNLLPPKYSLTIEEGSCGECCLWSLVNSKELNKVSQIDINKAGGDPGRGLRSNELEPALKALDIDYELLSKQFNPADSSAAYDEYKSFLYDDVIGAVKKGHPVLIGVKRYPTNFPQWPYDHFVLVVGYNEKNNELIYNDFSRRKRLNAETLINQDKNGYSFVNRYNVLFAIEMKEF